jgi:tetratricopeptide (TPR) repeat protein
MRILAALLLFGVAALGAAEDRIISAAEAAYDKGDYATAVEKWSEEARIEGVTPGRLSALGNAEWRLGRKGRAMVCWERALLLDPRDPVALAGIRHALNAGGTERPALTWSENYATFLTADAWLILATLAFWTALLCVVVPRIRRRAASERNHRTRVIALTILALCVPGLWGGRVLAARAVVRKADVSLRLTPTQFGEPLNGIAEGDVVRTDRPLNGHVRVITADGKTGWVRAGEIEAVRGAGLPADLDQKAAP